jgi:hypothetical protein
VRCFTQPGERGGVGFMPQAVGRVGCVGDTGVAFALAVRMSAAAGDRGTPPLLLLDGVRAAPRAAFLGEGVDDPLWALPLTRPMALWRGTTPGLLASPPPQWLTPAFFRADERGTPPPADGDGVPAGVRCRCGEALVGVRSGAAAVACGGSGASAFRRLLPPASGDGLASLRCTARILRGRVVDGTVVVDHVDDCSITFNPRTDSKPRIRANPLFSAHPPYRAIVCVGRRNPRTPRPAGRRQSGRLIR